METLIPASSLVSNSSLMGHQGYSSIWTKEDNKRFESALAMFDEKNPMRWSKVAEMIPGKSVCDVINQYRELVADVNNIEAGFVPVPGYPQASFPPSSFTLELAGHRGLDVYRKRARSVDQERKKGVPWTEDEHRRFLLGLKKHGKGDWRNISRNFVISKTPTQVASHAQKYYLRQLSGGKDKRRPSIHDITTINLTVDTPPTDNNFSQPCLFVDKSDEKNTANSPLEWNHNNDIGANLMMFDSDDAGSLIDIAKHSTRYIVNMAASSPAFYI